MSATAVALLKHNVCSRVDRDTVILVPDCGIRDDNLVAVVYVKGCFAMLSVLCILKEVWSSRPTGALTICVVSQGLTNRTAR